MTAAPLAPRTGFKFLLRVQEGPDKGATYQLLPPKVTIGRNRENDVALTDPRVSRQAAVIEFSMESIVISDLSARQSLFVNGQPHKQFSIKSGDIIRLGDSQMKFIVEAVDLSPQRAVAIGPMDPLMQPVAPNQGTKGEVIGFPEARSTTSPGRRPAMRNFHQHRSPESSSTPGSSSGRLRFYLIVSIVLGAIVYMGTSEDGPKPEETPLQTAESIQRDLKATEGRIEQLENERKFRSEEERTRFTEAQKHYLEGFRDYQKGQWVRAIKSFETARAIDPEHGQAQRYYILAEKKRDEMVALFILEGRRYLEKQMYTRCSAALEKVLDMIPNKDDPKYLQSEAIKKECDLRYEERRR